LVPVDRYKPEEKVVNHMCVACPTVKTSTGNHEASADSVTCEATACGTNVKGGESRVKTSTGKHKAASNDATWMSNEKVGQ